jgi:hypothetical protein
VISPLPSEIGETPLRSDLTGECSSGDNVVGLAETVALLRRPTLLPPLAAAGRPAGPADRRRRAAPRRGHGPAVRGRPRRLLGWGTGGGQPGRPSRRGRPGGVVAPAGDGDRRDPVRGVRDTAPARADHGRDPSARLAVERGRPARPTRVGPGAAPAADFMIISECRDGTVGSRRRPPRAAPRPPTWP